MGRMTKDADRLPFPEVSNRDEARANAQYYLRRMTKSVKPGAPMSTGMSDIEHCKAWCQIALTYPDQLQEFVLREQPDYPQAMIDQAEADAKELFHSMCDRSCGPDCTTVNRECPTCGLDHSDILHDGDGNQITSAELAGLSCPTCESGDPRIIEVHGCSDIFHRPNERRDTDTVAQALQRAAERVDAALASSWYPGQRQTVLAAIRGDYDPTRRPVRPGVKHTHRQSALVLEDPKCLSCGVEKGVHGYRYDDGSPAPDPVKSHDDIGLGDESHAGASQYHNPHNPPVMRKLILPDEEGFSDDVHVASFVRNSREESDKKDHDFRPGPHVATGCSLVIDIKDGREVYCGLPESDH